MSAEAPAALKEMFDVARYRQIGRLLKKVYPGFDERQFVTFATAGLDHLTLMQRMRRTTEACRATLPEDFPQAVVILKRLAPLLDHGFVSIFLCDFVGLYGHHHFSESMAALKFFTSFGSAEFAIREFLKRDLTRTLDEMVAWSRDPDEHVRRLASEGSRPRLPWSFHLESVSRDPGLTRSILENLNADPSLYVRKSVANHLNDVSKKHPDLMLAWLGGWDLKNPNTAWIARHASRSLIKAGNPDSFRLFGFTKKPEVKLGGFTVTPAKLKLGGTLTINFSLTSTAPKQQKLAVDYVVHYRKKTGQLSPKVFKLKEIILLPKQVVTLRKSQRIANFTTRIHYPGNHEIEIMANGRVLARRRFALET